MKFHIFLSEPTQSQQDTFFSRLGLEDVVMHLPFVDLPERIHKLSKAISSTQANVLEKVRKYYQVFGLTGYAESRQQSAYMDIFGMYSLGYLFSVEQIISDNAGNKFIFYSAKGQKSPPLLAIKTLESKHGSKTALGSSIAHQINIKYPGQDIEIIGRNPDLLGVSFIRLLALLLMEMVFSVRFLFRCWKIQRMAWIAPSKATKEVGGKGLVCIVRVPHQVSFLEELADNLNCKLYVIPLPQARQGALSDFTSSLKQLSARSNVKIVLQNPLNLLRACISGTLQHLASLSKFIYRVKINWSGKESEDSIWRAFSLEPMLQMSDFFYKSTLNIVLNQFRDSNWCLLSFAMKGRYAIFESDAARQIGLKTLCVQTAALDAYPSPVFPVFDIFYASSPGSRALLNVVGNKSQGIVKFSGAPLKVRPLTRISEVKSIAFFTQPYDQESTNIFVTSLIDLLSKLGIKLHIKFHPRDSIEEYQIGSSCIDEFRWKGDAKELIQSCDLTLARTSSVLFESLAFGRPALAVQLSDFDRKFSVDYLKLMRQEGLVVTDTQGLLGFIKNTTKLYTSNKLAREQLGLEQDITSLSADIDSEVFSRREESC